MILNQISSFRVLLLVCDIWRHLAANTIIADATGAVFTTFDPAESRTGGRSLETRPRAPSGVRAGNGASLFSLFSEGPVGADSADQDLMLPFHISAGRTPPPTVPSLNHIEARKRRKAEGMGWKYDVCVNVSD